MKKLFLFLAFLPVLSLHAQTKKEMKKAKEQFTEMMSSGIQSGSFHERVHFHNILGHILIKVMIHGKEYNFAFDTGAPTLVSDDLQKELNLPVAGHMNITDAGSEKRKAQEVYKLDELKLAGVSFLNVGCVASDLSVISNLVCTKIDGLFGVNMMKNCYWKINMQDSTLELSDELPAVPQGATTFHFPETIIGYIYLKMNTGDTSYYVEFDTGNGDPLRITDSLFLHTAAYKNNKYATGEGTAHYSLYGKNSSREYVGINDVMIDGQPFLGIVTESMQATQLLLGTPFIQNRETILDWAHHKMYLAPSSGTVLPDHSIYNMGVSIVITDDKLKVVFLWRGSPADKAGIQLGDEVVSVNGMDTRTPTQDQYCTLINSVQATSMDITVRHASGTETRCTLVRTMLVQ